jgi:flagellar biosynthesis anti-sigma factor FlgM
VALTEYAEPGDDTRTACTRSLDMFIDGKLQFPTDAQPEQVKTTKNTGGTPAGTVRSGGGSSASGEDTVSLSSTHGEVQALSAGVAAVPELRTARVNSLREQISQGQYQPTSQQVAGLLLGEHGKVNLQA